MSEVRLAEVFPPGEFVSEELEARGWSQSDLAKIIGTSDRLVNEVVRGRRAVTPETAQLLGEAFGTGGELWLNLESVYQLSRVEAADEAVARTARLYDKAPVAALIRRHWIFESADVESLEAQVLQLLGVDSIEDEPKLCHAARKSAPYENVSTALWAWLCRCTQLAADVEVGRYREGSVDDALAHIEPLLGSRWDSVKSVPRILADAGIPLVVVEALQGTKVDGACIWDGDRPIIALSLRFDRVDYFWFTLLHELAHALHGDGKSQSASVDTQLVGKGATADAALSAVERRANRFAAELLVPRARLTSFIRNTRPYFSGAKIERFAEKIGRHPGIVIGQLQRRGAIDYSHHRRYLSKVRAELLKTAHHDGWPPKHP